MTLPLLPASAGRWSGRCIAGAVLLALLLLGRAGLPAQAEDAAAFSATVPVDATADTVVKAREAARIDGQRRALVAVIDRLSGGSGATKLPKLGDQAITDLVTSFQVANEHMSTVRYVADYTFSFRPEAVRRLAGKAGIALGDQPGAAPQAAKPTEPAISVGAGKSLVVIPVYQAGDRATLWDDPNPWRDAWDRLPEASGPVRLVVPLGDAADLAGIDAGKARGGDAAALAAAAQRNGSDDAAVALAEMHGPADNPTAIDVTVRHYHAGQLADTHADSVSASPGESGADLLRRAAAAVTADIEGGWKKAQTANYDQQGSLTAVLPIASLDDWLHARSSISGLSAIRSLALVALSRQEATIEIDYAGSIDQLKSALAEISLDLVRGEPTWRLARSGAGRAP